MRVPKIVGLGVALAALAGMPALAFQEQQGSKGAAPAANEAPAVQDPAKDLNISDTTAGTSQGTEVRIPGLGRLGVLPKMDFGLELLYGAADPKQPDLPSDSPADAGDMTIRGTVKHRF